MNWKLTAVAILLVTAACGNTAGVGEFRVYAEAVDSLAAATQPLADRLRVAERENAVALIDGGSNPGGERVAGAQAGKPVKGLAPQFRVEHAVYFAESGDPPFAAAIRASIASLKRFNEAALVYADGRGLEAARADLMATADNISAGFSALGVAVPLATPAVSAFLEGVSGIGAFGSREAFRKILKAEGGRLDKLLQALIDSSPDAYNALTRRDYERRNEMISNGEDISEVTDRIVAERTLVAEWVLLIRLARSLLADALRAIDSPRTLGENAAGAAALSGDIRVRLERIRALTASGG